jgi:hypothetical protein
MSAEADVLKSDSPGEGEKPSASSSAPTTTHEARGKSPLRVLLEVALIGVGVFLGLMGDEWREHLQHRKMAEESLRRFRSEVRTNREKVESVKDYHVEMKKRIDTYLDFDPSKRASYNVALQGIRPVSFEHTAWDLAIATQALSYMDPELAFALSRIYGQQQTYATLSGGVLQAMYLRPPGQDLAAFFQTLALFYSDAVIMEPGLLAMYEEILPQLDRALNTAGQ